jgi:hypothetical protein
VSQEGFIIQSHKEIFLFFVTEDQGIRYYAFSETSPGKSGPFGAVNALKVKGS